MVLAEGIKLPTILQIYRNAAKFTKWRNDAKEYLIQNKLKILTERQGPAAGYRGPSFDVGIER